MEWEIEEDAGKGQSDGVWALGGVFGEVVAEYASGVDGEVGAIRTDVTSEPGNVLMFILFNHTPSEGEGGYPE